VRRQASGSELMFPSPQIMDKVIAGGIRLKAILVTCPSTRTDSSWPRDAGVATGAGCRRRPRGTDTVKGHDGAKSVNGSRGTGR
jgi:hypothetical protein